MVFVGCVDWYVCIISMCFFFLVGKNFDVFLLFILIVRLSGN